MEKYKTGDILVVGTWPIPLFNHFAIVFYKDGIGYVGHNSFKSKTILVDPLDQFLATRPIRRVYLSSGKVTDQQIADKIVELNKSGKTYNFFGYNCESFVREVCQCNWGADQRKESLIVVAAIVLISIIFYQALKRIN